MSKGTSSRSVVWRCSPAKRLKGGARGDIDGGGGGGPVVIWGLQEVLSFLSTLTHCIEHSTFQTCFSCCWRPTSLKPEPQGHSVT
jgi:hypothetical protein